jgi:hypothetical protein
MTNPTAKLFEVAGNYALVQVEGRRFPGLLIQGDSLSIVRAAVRELQASLEARDDEATGYAMQEVEETVSAMMESYETMMRHAGLTLPY